MPPPEPSPALELGAQPAGYRSGFVSLVGRPNVGKSTLLNQILRRKVAITSERPQTTRNAIRGILTTVRAQLVFVDTPGLHKPRTALGEGLNRLVRSTLTEVDVVVFLVDVAAGAGKGDELVATELVASGKPVLVALNKIDSCTPAQLQSGISRLTALGLDPVLGISARTGDGVADLVESIVERLPEGPLYYPPEEITDQSTQRMVAELIREKALELTREEVPHSVAVMVEEMEAAEEDESVDIHATIYVERSSQKGIVIGKGGKMLKEIGSRARQEIEPLLGRHVYLDLRVKVERDWQRRRDLVERFGYGS